VDTGRWTLDGCIVCQHLAGMFFSSYLRLFLFVGEKVVEPPELHHISYVVDRLKAEMEKQGSAAAAEAEMMMEDTKSESKSNLRKSMAKLPELPEDQEAKAPEGGSKRPEADRRQSAADRRQSDMGSKPPPEADRRQSEADRRQSETGSKLMEVGSKQDTTLKERKDVERPPIFVTLQ